MCMKYLEKIEKDLCIKHLSVSWLMFGEGRPFELLLEAFGKAAEVLSPGR